jgi:hypothetical protein
MTEQEFLTFWLIGLAIAALVVVIAAGLLLAVLASAKSIERGAVVALDVVTKIDNNTDILWQLEDTNNVANQLNSGAEAILSNAGIVAAALHEADVRRGDTSSRILPGDARGA